MAKFAVGQPLDSDFFLCHHEFGRATALCGIPLHGAGDSDARACALCRAAKGARHACDFCAFLYCARCVDAGGGRPLCCACRALLSERRHFTPDSHAALAGLLAWRKSQNLDLEAGASAVAFFISNLRGSASGHGLALSVLAQFHGAICVYFDERTIVPIAIALSDHLKNCGCWQGVGIDLYCTLAARFPRALVDSALLTPEFARRELLPASAAVAPAARLMFIMASHRRWRPDTDEVLQVLQRRTPRAQCFLLGALAHYVGVPDALRLPATVNAEHAIARADLFAPVVLGFLREREAPLSAVYFASCLAYHWSLTEGALLLLRENVSPSQLQALIDRFRPTAADSPGSQIAILLFATLLHLWRRFARDPEYGQALYAVIPNIVVPICGADEAWPFSERSYLSVMETIALDCVQAICAVPGRAGIFENARFAALVTRRRNERAAAARRRVAEHERLYSREMERLEALAQEMERVRAAGAGNESGPSKRPGEAATVVRQAKEELAERERRLAELGHRQADAEARRAELEAQVARVSAAIAGKDAEIARLAADEEDGVRRVAELEGELALAQGEFTRKSETAAVRWRAAADRVLSRAGADADLNAIFAVDVSDSAAQGQIGQKD
jgi:hypothetical protein